MPTAARRCRTAAPSLLLAGFAAAWTCALGVAPGAAQEAILVHETTAANRPVSFQTILDEPLLNGNPNAVFLVNQAWAARGLPVENPHPIGLYYQAGSGNWVIENQDGAEIPLGADFYVWIPSPAATSGPAPEAYRHVTTSGNVSNNLTVLDHPDLNENPTHYLHVSAYKPSSLFPYEVGTWYSEMLGRWTIFLESPAVDMPVGVTFMVCLESCGLFPTSYAYNALSSTGANTVGSVTFFPAADHWSAALVSRGYVNEYHDNPIGVLFDPFGGGWAVFNEDGAEMDLGVRFVTLVSDGVFASGIETASLLGWTPSP